MKNILKFCTSVVLTCVLSLSVFAGQMDTMITDPPPPPTEIEGQTPTTSGEAVDPVAEIAISLLQSVLPLF